MRSGDNMTGGLGINHGDDVAPGTELPEEFELGDGVRRDSRCVEAWAWCESGEYNPYCCRFPKSCSATSVPNRVYRRGILEPARISVSLDTREVTPPPVQPGDKVKLIVGEKTWVGVYPDGPWEELR